MRYHHLEMPELNQEAFKKDPTGKIKLYGKGSAPEAPDYEGAARETAAGNRASAEYTTKANRINQFTPYGSLTYQYKPQYEIDPKTGKPRIDPQTGQKIETGGGWSQRVNLTPAARAALNQQLALNTKFGRVANIGFDRARNIFENPQLDTSRMEELYRINFDALPKAPINAGKTAQQALMSRLQPQLAQQEDQLAARLANQGIGLGSDAFRTSMRDQFQRRNDLELQAAYQGLTLDQQARQQALNEEQLRSNSSAALRQRQMEEQAYLQDRPLNLINALRSGNQVNAPQFQQFALQQQTAGPDVLGAAQQQYGANLNAYNANQAASGGMMGGLFSLGMGAAGLPVAGGGSLGGNFIKGLF